MCLVLPLAEPHTSKQGYNNKGYNNKSKRKHEKKKNACQI